MSKEHIKYTVIGVYIHTYGVNNMNIYNMKGCTTYFINRNIVICMCYSCDMYQLDIFVNLVFVNLN